jgi:hypothetical protein
MRRLPEQPCINMKLYATTTSERASKGQGGNEYIRVELRQAKNTPVEYYIEYNQKGLLIMDSTYGTLLETGKLKGNKQKDENNRCEHGMPYKGKLCIVCNPQLYK